MLTSNVVIWTFLSQLGSSLLLPLPHSTEAGCNSLELPLVVREQLFRRLVGYI